MTDRERSGATAPGVMSAAPRPEALRNVAIVGPSGAGKTSLVEALLVVSGTIPRAGRVEDGTTVSDFDEVEVRQQRSVGLALAPLEWAGIRVNLLDTPGYADFVGELRAGLRAADAALFVVSAVDGVDGVTSLLWEECAAVQLPRAVVVSKLDASRADFEQTLASCQEAFGEGVLPVYLPLHDEKGGVAGLIGLLSEQVFDYSSGTRTTREADAAHLPAIAPARAALIEGIIAESEDETLMDRYLEGEDLDTAVLVDDLETAVARGHFYPVLGVASPTQLGVHELLDMLTNAFPSPLEHPAPLVTRPDGSPVEPLKCDLDGRLAAEVVATSTDPYVGRVSLVRVFSGTLRPGDPVHVSGHGQGDPRFLGHADHDVDEKIGALSSPLGKAYRPVECCVAGDICAVAKLSHAETGDTLSGRDAPLLVAGWTMPQPLLPVAVAAHSRADEDKLGVGLARLVAEDATLRVEHNLETGQLILWCMGEAHADVALERLRTKYAVAVDAVPVRVPLRETFAGSARAQGRHVKQSGGHGQYAVCVLDVEPLPQGGGFEFVDRVVGGAVPRQFIASVEKGVRAQLTRGVAAGYPLVDLRVSLVDGKAHSVDSSDLAFQTAGALALKEAAKQTTITLLEPVLDVEVVVPEALVGAVMSDLSGRRGRVTGSGPAGDGRAVVRADVPEVEMLRYAVELRSLTSGTGNFRRAPARYEPMPPERARGVLADVAG